MTFLNKRTKAEIALMFATLLWGLTFPFVRIVLEEISPAILVFWRGLIASIVFFFFVFFRENGIKKAIKLAPFGLILGFLYFTSYLTQTIGLQTIESGRSAFITNLSVIFVPLLSPVFRHGTPTRNDIVSACVAITGLFLLTNPFSSGGFKDGDIWTMICALGFSVQIHLIQKFMKKYKEEYIFSFLQVFFVGSFSFLTIPLFKSGSFYPHTMTGIIVLIFLALFAMVLTTWLQSRFQFETTAERASVIYVLEPVFACAFGYILLSEKMTLTSMLGALIMVSAVVWIYIFRFFRKRFFVRK